MTPASNSTSYEIYPKQEFSEAESAIEATILSIICLVATIGNISFWYVIFSDATLRTTSNALILCLSMADILVSVINMPLAIVTIIKHDWIFNDLLCVVSGFLNMTTFIASVMSLASISINRYVLVCHSSQFKNAYNKRNAAAMVLGVWLLAMFLAMPPLIGWGRYGFLPGQSFCFCQWKTSISYTFFMVGVCFGGPCSIMSFCYMKILCSYRESRRRVDNNSGPQRKLVVPSSERNTADFVTKQREIKRKQKKEEDRRLTKSLLIVIFIFIICWLPFCVTMFWSVFSNQPVPRVVDVISLILGFSNSCCNPIIYGLMNNRFKEGFRKLFKCKCFSPRAVKQFFEASTMISPTCSPTNHPTRPMAQRTLNSPEMSSVISIDRILKTQQIADDESPTPKFKFELVKSNQSLSEIGSISKS